MRKLRKLAEKNSIDFKLEEQATHDGKVIAETYSFPKKFITIRSKAIHQNLTEEQKQAAVERMRDMTTYQTAKQLSENHDLSLSSVRTLIKEIRQQVDAGRYPDGSVLTGCNVLVNIYVFYDGGAH
ncbi:MAG: hypothetical protein LIO91_13285 [Bacteroidales bacterium]|nr:hypothetical protein [Bacteroidales bacterium]